MANLATSFHKKVDRLLHRMQQPLSTLRYRLLILVVIAQAATLLITWPLWQVRDFPVHMPAFELSQIPFGGWLLLTLLYMLIQPRWGLVLHATSLLISFVFDQYRTQPQFIALAVLMLALIEDNGVILVRWFLATLWLWAGLHKLLSPDWFTHAAWDLVGGIVTDRAAYFQPFAWGVGIGEVIVGLLAILQPRWAAIPCLLMHVGIAIFLSPLFYDHNISVIPWNLATGIVGCWVMLNAPSVRPRFTWEWGIAAVLLLYPAGFYVGWVDHGVASVLYSNHLPEGLITTPEGTEVVQGWGALKVPFPNERRLLRIYFEQSASPGSKLHIDEQRSLLPDQYFVKRADHRVEEISRQEFHNKLAGEVAGIENDRRRNRFLLARAGVKMLKRDQTGPIYAVEMDPSRFRPELLRLLNRIPNIEQLNLAGCQVTNEDLKHLPILPKLEGIGLADTQVTDEAISLLRRQPQLKYIEHKGSRMTREAVLEFERQRKELDFG
ncbi:DoxX family protein [Bremerella cremea]|uniref:DoxX family protein n=1 Tax=Bremerella cremea TaxID=1031537 RepID=A0A368KNQ3_9BACT|nr:DoxX family protein [Bremerella cremea]RCS46073.1 DoxX family protein [Bremerella cremea]